MQTKPPKLYKVSVILLILLSAVLSIAVWRLSRQVPNSGKELSARDAGSIPINVQPIPAPAANTLPDTNNATAPTTTTSVQVQVSPAPPGPELELTPTGFEPKPRWDGLSLVGTHVVAAPDGLKTTMRFNPTTMEPLGVVDIVVRIDGDAAARILDFEATGPARFSKAVKRVAENGKFAVFHGTLESADAVEFSLSVSGDAVADVRGTTGIGAFDLVIKSVGATVHPKQAPNIGL